MGERTTRGSDLLSRYLLDTTVIVAHLRGDSAVTNALLGWLADGHILGTSCVTVAEIERGLRASERKAVKALFDRLAFFGTTREAATRAGRYQADWARRGRTIHTPDALIAGTARAHGAVVVTDNLNDFPMTDIRVVPSPRG